MSDQLSDYSVHALRKKLLELDQIRVAARERVREVEAELLRQRHGVEYLDEQVAAITADIERAMAE